MKQLNLCGSWDMILDLSAKRQHPEQMDGESDWQVVSVPGCWEQVSADKTFEGPVWYRKQFDVPLDWIGIATVLECCGINYYCEVWLNGYRLGDHVGGWAGFRLCIPRTVLKCGQRNQLLVKVYKQGTRFELRESLAGFLPDVNFIFGGIWKPILLKQAAAVEIRDVFVKPRLDTDSVEVEYTLQSYGSAPVEVLVSCLIDDNTGHKIASTGEVRVVTSHARDCYELVAKFIGPVDCWTPEHPALYELSLCVVIDGATIYEHHSRFGMREVSVSGSTLMLNKKPIYLRGVLHWGWYPHLSAPIPTRAQIRDELCRIKEHGFNLVKLCLFVPTVDYFELADEIGILIWQELPMWQPVVSPEFRQTAYEQYEHIINEIRDHPSLIVWTLGCELNRTVDAGFLKELYDLAKRLTDRALIRDNSGSGECYGGLLNEFADFYDYHFYTDVQFFQDLLAQFAGPWRPVKPWVFGEFCDYDTYRDVKRLRASNGGELPWWLRDDPSLNPASTKQMVSYTRQEEKITRLDLPFSDYELRENSLKSAYAYRKMVLELVRTHPQLSGYVITSIWDTPLSTSAIFDELGNAKHEPKDFWKINHDVVIALTWDQRRDWIAGGDRIVHWDHLNYFSEDWLRPHIFLSYYARQHLSESPLQWHVSAQNSCGRFSEGTRLISAAPGEAREVSVLDFQAPKVTTAQKIQLEVSLNVGDGKVENSWAFWILPRVDTIYACLYDPRGLFAGLESCVSGIRTIAHIAEADPASVVITTHYDDALTGFVKNGGHAVYLQRGTGEFQVECMPFWRESLQLFYPHPLTSRFPHENHTGTLLQALATDTAFSPVGLPAYTPLLARLDARTFSLHHYMVELGMGSGRLIATTLRLEGGLGNEPTGIQHSPVGLFLLNEMVDYLINS